VTVETVRGDRFLILAKSESCFFESPSLARRVRDNLLALANYHIADDNAVRLALDSNVKEKKAWSVKENRYRCRFK
jgi:hypothetical protein